jgi:hypothetical protein
MSAVMVGLCVLCVLALLRSCQADCYGSWLDCLGDCNYLCLPQQGECVCSNTIYVVAGEACHETSDGSCTGSCMNSQSACVSVPVPSPDRRHGDRCKCVSLTDNLLPFSTDAFNNLSSIYDAHQKKADYDKLNNNKVSSEMAALAQALVDAGVGDFTGVVLLHKHFELAPGELVVEIVSNASSLTVPLMLSPNKTAVKSATVDSQLKLLPHTFAVHDSNALPLEYAMYTPGDLLEARYKLFVAAVPTLFPKLQQVQRSGLFGVAIRHRDGIVDASKDAHTVEMVSEHRWLLVQPSSAEQQSALMQTGLTTSTFWPALQLVGDGDVLNNNKIKINKKDEVTLCAHDCQHVCTTH